MRRQAWRLLVLGLSYYGGAKLGLALALYNSQVTPFWPPTGIALAAFLLWGRRVWPAVAVAAFAVNVPLSTGVQAPLLISAGNVLAPLVGSVLLERAGFRPEMRRLRDATALVALGAAAMTISASVGVAALITDGLPTSLALEVWTTWWTGDAVGALVVTPFLLCLHALRHAPRPSLARVVEGGALLALTGATTWYGFSNSHGLRFLVFPVVAVAAVRFQLRGAAPNALMAALVATYAASQGVGLFAGKSNLEAMAVLQVFNACVTFTSYLLAALTADRLRALHALARQGGELERLVEERTEELSTALDRLARAQQIARMGSYDLDARTGDCRWSDELYRLVGREVGSPMNLDVYAALCHPDERDWVQGVIATALATGEPFTMDHRLRHADGTWRWLHCQGQVVRDADGAVIGVRGTATDIHDRKTLEGRFEQLVEMAPDAMVFVDQGGLITQVNLQTEALFGYRRNELVGLPLEVLIPERFRGAHKRHRLGFLNRPGLRPMGQGLDLLALRKDGTEFPVEISLSPLETPQGTLVSASIRDTTERKRQQDELAYRGLHDALTGLPNRVLLTDRLVQTTAALERQPGCHAAVVFLDLDRFKWVNDSLGHNSGDTLLRSVASRLTAAVRPEDSVARFGGDEFVVVSGGLHSVDEAVALTERIRESVSVPVTLAEGHTLVPTLSIGLTTTDDPRADPAALLRDADAAMYRAKEQGRDRTAFFEPEIHAQMRSRLATAGGLRQAIEQGQLRVHYQPIVDLESGRPLSVEALVRWQHPERGLLMPGDFVQLAEETGQVGELDRTVLVTACREFGLVAAQHPELSLNVNVSLRHLSRPRLREALVLGLAEGGLSPQQLTVEVTESADLSGEEFAELLATVKELGVKVAIDDFGTGFSALSRLNDLGVDTIKVDRSFVRDIHVNDRAQVLVAAMTQLSQALDATVIAEGIEDPEQAAVLRRLGCKGGQGYLWSKPVELAELATWIERRGAIRVPVQRPSELERA